MSYIHVSQGTVSDAEYDPISLAECKINLLINTSVTDDDDYIDKVRKGVFWFFEKKIGFYLMQRSVADEKHSIDTTHQDTLVLLNRPIISIAALTDDVSAVSSDNYGINKEAGVITLKDAWFTSGFEKAQVSYVCGFAQSDFPEDIITAMLMLVKTIYDESYSIKDQFTEQIGRYTMIAKMGNRALPTFVEEVINYHLDRGIA